MTRPHYFRLLPAIAGLLLVNSLAWSQTGDQTVPQLPKDNLPDELLITTPPKGLSSLPAASKDNPLTRPRIALGRRLFFDPVLSKDGSVSCASCHQPDHGFASPDPKAIGIAGKVGKRNTPTVLNRGFGKHFFWDGRVATLEEQALEPISNPLELGNEVETVLQALRQDESYVAEFRTAFAGSDDTTVSAANLARAIASFERALVTGNSPVDRFRASEYEALNRKARQGMWIFESRGGCWQCHSGPNLSDEEFHNTGVSFGSLDRDTGRFEFTGKDEDRFKFKTPSLRNVQFTAPYMHDGSVKTLRQVVEFYNKGGAPDDPRLDKKMKPLNLSEEEVEFLVEFLKAYSGDAIIDRRK